MTPEQKVSQAFGQKLIGEVFTVNQISRDSGVRKGKVIHLAQVAACVGPAPSRAHGQLVRHTAPGTICLSCRYTDSFKRCALRESL